MAGQYPSLLAAGVTEVGRFDQFDLYAGESDIVSSQGQAADGVAIPQFCVISLDMDGRVVPWDASGQGYANATATFDANPAAGDTLTINGVAIGFVASGATGAQVNIGATTAGTAANLAALINGTLDSVDPDTALPIYGVEPLDGTGVRATVSGNVVTLGAIEPGTAGNAVTLAKSGAHPVISGATLAGGSAEVDTEAKQAIGIAAQPVAASTPGTYLPYFTGGVFNHEALVWPPSVATLGQRQRAFAGTDIGVRQLL